MCASIVEVKGSEIVAADCCNYNLQGMWLINALLLSCLKEEKKKKGQSVMITAIKKKKKNYLMQGHFLVWTT